MSVDDVRRLCWRIAGARDVPDPGFVPQERSEGSAEFKPLSALMVDSYPAAIMIRAWLDEHHLAWMQVLDEDLCTEEGTDIWVILTEAVIAPWD